MSYNELHDLHHSNTMLTCIKGASDGSPPASCAMQEVGLRYIREVAPEPKTLSSRRRRQTRHWIYHFTEFTGELTVRKRPYR